MADAKAQTEAAPLARGVAQLGEVFCEYAMVEQGDNYWRGQ